MRAATDHRLLGVAVSVMTSDAAPAVLACSHSACRTMEEIQFSVGEGPGIDAFTLGRPVLVANLSAAMLRWPGYVPRAIEAGLCAVYAFPLQLGAVRFGVLSCHADVLYPLDDTGIVELLSVADRATELLLAASSDDVTSWLSPGTDDVLAARSEVFQAQGMVMAQLGVSLGEALARMRALAFATDLDLATLAVRILDGTVRVPHD